MIKFLMNHHNGTKQKRKNSFDVVLLGMRNDAGFAILEIVISVGLIATALFALSGVARLAYRATTEASDRTRAGFLLEEGFEAIKTIRDTSWAAIENLTPDQSLYLVFSGGQWSATTSPQTTDSIFTRSVVVRAVLRDASQNIAASGTNDPDTRKVEVSVAWNERGRMLVASSTTYVTNLFLEP
ncbi:MAG: hypothetical protein HYS44_04030 [Candidatus Niyogibacteria bacterium]|nr:hypothetical protein [Candidatus Niyogibacteria bacterium]